MKETLFNILKTMALLAVIAGLFYMTNMSTTSANIIKTENPNLTIFGDNIDSSYQPYIKDGKVYISTKTVGNFIDDKIVFASDTQKLIITTDDGVYKFKFNSDTATRNFKEYNCNQALIRHNEAAYIAVDAIKDIYNIKSDYNEETNTISIDKKGTSDLPLNYNKVNVYSDLKTDSNILETLGMNNTVTVYTESLKHNRWYKVKTDSGKIGYIEKSAVTVKSEEEIEQEQKEEQKPQEKIIGFWQYGSKVETLGDKIDAVDVVMPTWFALSAEDGSVEMKYSKEYYQKAKANGYKLWPIITNGLDSESNKYVEYTSKCMNSEENRENLIKNIIDILNTYNIDGINVDFENMREADKYMYTQFLRELHPLMKENGKTLSADIYFTSYIDRSGLGHACDYVMLMGYDQRGNWSTEAGSISEISWVEKQLLSLMNDSEIDPSKIILGVPFYTRLWNEAQDGTLTTNVYSMQNSQDFIDKYNLEKKMDEEAGQNYVEFNDTYVTYKLWIEDAESMQKRADLVNKYGLSGVAAWQRGFETPDIWTVLDNALKTK